MGKTNVSMHFRYNGNLPDCPGKRTAQRNIYSTKNMQHFLQPRFWGNRLEKKYLLTALLNLPVEEEVSISRQYSAYYLNNVSKRDKIKERCTTATQLMHELRYMYTRRRSYEQTSVYGWSQRAKSGNRSLNKCLSTRTCLSESLGIIARTKHI